MKAITITAGGTVDHIEIDSSGDLAQLQKAVGGYIEIVTLTSELALVLDEEGKLKGKQANAVATSLTRLYNAGLQEHDIIVGDVILIGQNDGRMTDIPDAAVETVTQIGSRLTAAR